MAATNKKLSEEDNIPIITVVVVVSIVDASVLVISGKQLPSFCLKYVECVVSV